MVKSTAITLDTYENPQQSIRGAYSSTLSIAIGTFFYSSIIGGYCIKRRINCGLKTSSVVLNAGNWIERRCHTFFYNVAELQSVPIELRRMCLLFPWNPKFAGRVWVSCGRRPLYRTSVHTCRVLYILNKDMKIHISEKIGIERSLGFSFSKIGFKFTRYTCS